MRRDDHFLFACVEKSGRSQMKRQLSLRRRMLAEFSGTLVLVLIGTLSYVV